MSDNTVYVGENNGGYALNNVMFYEDEIRDNFKSEKQGKEVFITKEMIEIRTPGDTNNVIVRIATEHDKQVYANQYMAYKVQHGQEVDGTPIDEMTDLDAQARTALKQIGFITVEQLANASDGILQRHMGGMRFRRMAVDFLKNQGTAAQDEQEKRIAELEEKLAQLIAQPKPRGRKPKEA